MHCRIIPLDFRIFAERDDLPGFVREAREIVSLHFLKVSLPVRQEWGILPFCVFPGDVCPVGTFMSMPLARSERFQFRFL
jgi:hypothetical protein